MEIASRLRLLPSVDEVALRLAGLGYPRRLLIAEIRRALAEAREQLRGGAENADIDSEVIRSLSALRGGSLRRVINATGVILHTNLGRAPLSPRLRPEGIRTWSTTSQAGGAAIGTLTAARCSSVFSESPPSPSTTTPPRSIWCFRSLPAARKWSSRAAS